MTTTKSLSRIAARPLRNKIETGYEYRKRLPKLMIIGIAATLALAAQPVFGQLRIVGRISGTVEDQAGAVIPKAKVVLKDSKTGIIREAAASSEGTFLFPDLATGQYEVTVTAQGFQTAVLSDIAVSTNQTTDVKVIMSVGQMTEMVQVTGDVEARLETSSQLVASTLATKTITELPVANRSNVLALARLAPGAAPATGGSTRYNNLAGGAVNVTVDGINDASNGFKSGGTVFFMTVPVRLGAVDELTVETTGLSADKSSGNAHLLSTGD
ncbi:MAG TPA: carboxypeptidase-like regulatory domain-containing protein [Blastocatellia bacterium]